MKRQERGWIITVPHRLNGLGCCHVRGLILVCISCESVAFPRSNWSLYSSVSLVVGSNSLLVRKSSCLIVPQNDMFMPVCC